LHCGGRLVETAPRWCGRIAQLVEQLTLNQRVVGSNPTAPTNDFNILRGKLAEPLCEALVWGFTEAQTLLGRTGQAGGMNASLS
jgi:phosphoketolase